ncbi:hypothetical protein JUN65_12650 [Gluconacetobacter azotocaptans]|uniref:hypothetical protein n=1 Tax=Gluconacetobacter azotocaptans TaxID=142834 RepID=UPI00195D59E9|nr:hypothetical protein [Gluconacetobacter azotocaptans]MBM9402431.1 hypothetical protein [Gluconacetobacter azotocaptans]
MVMVVENVENAQSADVEHDNEATAKTPSNRFLKRHVLPSDNHGFIGHIYDLSIVVYHFDNYEALSKHPDCKYAFDTNEYVSLLVRRVESLNLVGNMLWPDPFPTAISLPISLYEWLTASADVFLTRYVSVVDCALQLVNAVYEAGLAPVDCKMKKLKRAGVSASVLDHLGRMLDEQARLRTERNARIHEGKERCFTSDDQAFRIAARFNGIKGIDRYGRRINVNRSFREGLVGLQKEFNNSTRVLVRQLDALYDELGHEFEARFGPRFVAAKHGLNASAPRQ